MTTNQVLAELKKASSEQIKNILLKHGAKEPFYGVRVEDIKKIMKKVTANRQAIALELFDSGIGEAQYMAGLMADGSQMTKKQLQSWVKKAHWSMVSDFAVPWVTCENKDAFTLAEEWINSSDESIACSGWSTLSSILSTWPDEKLDMEKLRSLLKRITLNIHEAPYRVQKLMQELAEILPQRPVVLARELTKKFEEFLRGAPAALMEHFSRRPPKGEFVVLIGPAVEMPPPPED